MPDDTMLLAALRYAAKGWPVFPLKPGTKVPLTKHGVLDAEVNEDWVRHCWTQHPDANIGIATGKQSGLWVLDLDNKQLVEEEDGTVVGLGDHSLRELEQRHGRLPDTLSCITGGGGVHLYFAYPGGDLRNRAGIAPSVDVRAEGGYVVAPPSTHASGARYRWFDDDSDPLSLPPRWLVELASRAERPVDLQPGEKVPEGERNDWLWRKACQLVGDGMDPDDIRDVILTMNETRLDPPGDPAKALDMVERALKEYTPNVAKNIVFDDDQAPATVEAQEGAWIATPLVDFLATPIPPPKKLVDGLLNGSTGAILAGPPNVGKSWLALDLGLAVATGGSFLGRSCEQGVVLYVDEEGTPYDNQERLTWMLNGRGIASADLPFYLAMDKGFKLDTSLGEMMFRAMVDHYKPDLLILDSMVRFHTRDEKDPQAMARLFEITKKLMKLHGTTVLFLHHTRKPGIDAQDLEYMIRGSGEISAWASTTFVAWPNKDRDCFEFHHTKARSRRKQDPQLLRLVVDEGLGTAALENLGTPSGESRSSKSTKVAAALAGRGGVASVQQIAADLEVTSKTAREYLQRMEALGQVSYDSGRHVYQQLEIGE